MRRVPVVRAKDLHTWGTEVVLPKDHVPLTELKARVQVVLARDLRTRVDPAVHHMVPIWLDPVVHRAVPVHRTMQSVPAVRPRAHHLMEPDLVVRAKVLGTQADPAVPQIRLNLPMKENQGAGERKIEPIRRAKYQSTVEFLLSVFFLTPLR